VIDMSALLLDLIGFGEARTLKSKDSVDVLLPRSSGEGSEDWAIRAAGQ
jgi:hypothetical protein